LRKIAEQGLSGPITLVLDNARYQRNAVVKDLAKELGSADAVRGQSFAAHPTL